MSLAMAKQTQQKTPGDVVREVRLRREKSTREFALLLGCHHSQVVAVEQGRIKDLRNFYRSLRDLLLPDEKAALIKAESETLKDLLNGKE